MMRVVHNSVVPKENERYIVVQLTSDFPGVVPQLEVSCRSMYKAKHPKTAEGFSDRKDMDH